MIIEFNNENLDKATKLLDSDEAIVFPTETVYGLAVKAHSLDAVGKLYDIKGRDGDKPITLMLHNLNDLEKYVCVGDLKECTLEHLKQGTTIVFKLKDSGLQHIARKGNDMYTLGVRIPKNTEALQLLGQVNYPLAVTSANLSGGGSLMYADDVCKQLGDKILILKSDICSGIPSSVIDVSSGVAVKLR